MCLAFVGVPGKLNCFYIFSITGRGRNVKSFLLFGAGDGLGEVQREGGFYLQIFAFYDILAQTGEVSA